MRVIEELNAAFAVLVTVMLTLRQVIRFGQALVVVPAYMRPTGLVVRVKLLGLAPQVNVLVVAVAGGAGESVERKESNPRLRRWASTRSAHSCAY